MKTLVDFGRPTTPYQSQNEVFQPRVQKILNWNLEEPKQFLIKRQGVDPEEAEQMITEYRRFVVLCALNPKLKFPVSEKVDSAWHAHILFSDDYKDMCQQVFGRELAHHPVLTELQQAELMPAYHRNTLVEYEALFGKPNEVMWPLQGRQAAICWGSGGGGQGD